MKNQDTERMLQTLADSLTSVTKVDEQELKTALKTLGLDIDPNIFKQAATSMTEKTIAYIHSLDETEAKVAVFVNELGIAFSKQFAKGNPSGFLKPGQLTSPDEGLVKVAPSSEVELTALIEMLQTRLNQLYTMRRGQLITLPSQHVDGDPIEAWCCRCGRSVVRPSDGEDTCSSCLRNI
jgi:hypothetical protein